MTSSIVENNLLRLKQDIVPYTPRIIAVTKYYDESAVIEAFNAGLRDFGESRAIDAITKIESLPEKIRKESKFHFIGHLQTNKVNKVVKYFDYIQSVDSCNLAKAISESALKIGKVQKILIQANISGEVQKFGFEPEILKTSLEELKQYEGIHIEGLMCMAPLGADKGELNLIFSKAKTLSDECNRDYGMNFTELSMGMSDDYVYAVRNGATMIRIGRLLFN